MTLTLTSTPTEIVVHILSFLPPESISSISQTCRFLNSVSRIDSLWKDFCRRISSPAPFESWRELFILRWYKWSWITGIWCGDYRYQGISDKCFFITNYVAGNLMLCRYNSKSGEFDFHVSNLSLYTISRLKWLAHQSQSCCTAFYAFPLFTS